MAKQQKLTYEAEPGQGSVRAAGVKFRPGETKSVSEKVAKTLLDLEGFKFSKAEGDAGDDPPEPESTSEPTT